MKVFGSSGVRGVANEDLLPRFVMQVTQAAGSEFDAERVALARDTRLTGPMFADAAASGLESVGCTVDRLGIAPTPALQAYCEREIVPGVMITASHNPPEYNGIKLISDTGVELTRGVLERVEDRLEAEPELVDWSATGDSRYVETARESYREQLLAAVSEADGNGVTEGSNGGNGPTVTREADGSDAAAIRERIADAELTVAIDPGHGAGALTNPDFFRELGCRVLTVNAQPDGRFPGREPEPIADNLDDLARLTRTSDADLGIAHDGDADRAIFIDETGTFIEGDAALAALAAAELEDGDVAVSAVNASQRFVDVVEDAGADLRLTPIGSTYLITAIRELQERGRRVPIAGEGNGGIIFPGYRIARDGAYTAARFCALLADRPASDLAAEYDDYYNVRRDVSYDGKEQREAMLDAIEETAEESAAELDTTDGYRLDYGDAWVLARPSGTEPLIRVYAEARAESRARELADEMVAAIEDA